MYNPDYEQYYASLAASSAVSVQDTPSSFGAALSQFDDLQDDEEDRKPSIEYLDSLNDYRKRSRSREDEGTAKKIAKVEDVNDLHFGTDSGEMNGVTNGHTTVDTPMADGHIPEDDPLVHGSSVYLTLLSVG